MRVEVERHGDCRVAERFLNDLRMDATGQRDRGIAVPQVVDANRWESRPLEQRSEPLANEIPAVNRHSVCRREDNVAILPRGTCYSTLHLLSSAMAS
jgi:hypothetical protein